MDKHTNCTRPTTSQIAWQDAEIGVVYHYDMPVFGAGGWNGKDAIHKTWSPDTFNPQRLDTDQWLEAARAMGARYAIFTATHFNGFLQWQSDLYEYGLKQTSWRNGKGDVVGDFIASCRRVGIKPGIYMSCFRNAWWHVDKYKVNYGAGGSGQIEFANTCEKMVEEICTRYGELFEIWFDAGLIAPEDGGPDVLPIIEKHQPNIIFYHSPDRRDHRWIGNESGYAGYPCWATLPDHATAEQSHKQTLSLMLEHGDPNGKLWSPGMVDVPLRDHDWLWVADHDDKLESLDELVNFYYRSVGRNANLLIGLAPDTTGRLPQTDLDRCREFGDEIEQRFAKPVAKTSGSGYQILLQLDNPCVIDDLVIMEDISYGERIREYVVEGKTGQGFVKLCEGKSVGHKRIEQLSKHQVSEIKLTVTAAVETPMIKEMSVYMRA